MVKLNDIAPSSGSRARGMSAYELLQPYIEQHTDVRIDIPSDELVTASFLDELVRLLGEAGQLGHVTFVLSSDEIEVKLARISGTRQLSVLAARGAERFTIAPMSFDSGVEEASEKGTSQDQG